jgi:amino acid transporter
MERIYGSTVATIFTAFVLWTAFGSVFALLLGYSRIPYAAALDGTFFRVFGRVHAQKRFPHVSLLVIGVLAIVASALPLDIVIASLITTRILIQFVGQIAVVIRLRRTRPDGPRPFRMWLYPAPVVIALAGWTFVFVTSGTTVIGFGLLSLGVGVAAYLIWQRKHRGTESIA